MNVYCFHVLDNLYLYFTLQWKHGARQRCSDAGWEGKVNGSSGACDPQALCFWAAFLAPLEITLCTEMESNTGTFWSNFYLFTDHNEFRKRKPSHPCISDSGADFEHGKGWTFYRSFHFRSWWKPSAGVFKSYLFSLSDLVTALVKAGKGQSRILPSQQILAGSSGEEWSHSFPLPSSHSVKISPFL